jgi:hypothetical protein
MPKCRGGGGDTEFGRDWYAVSCLSLRARGCRLVFSM